MSESNSYVYACDEVREVQRLHGDLFTDDFRQLPIREQLEQQAKRLVEAHESGDEAVATHIKWAVWLCYDAPVEPTNAAKTLDTTSQSDASKSSQGEFESLDDCTYGLTPNRARSKYHTLVWCPLGDMPVKTMFAPKSVHTSSLRSRFTLRFSISMYNPTISLSMPC